MEGARASTGAPVTGRAGAGPRSALPGETLPPGALPDFVRPGLSLLVVGSNPGMASSQAGHYYAAPSNAFWRLLADAGLTPGRWGPERDAELLSLGIGLTDIVKRPTPGMSDLTARDLAQGRERLRQILAIYRPAVAAYTAKAVYAAFRGGRDTKAIAYGLQPGSVVAGVRDFVLPSPSGRSGLPYAEKLRWYRELAQIVKAG
ncbi:MAG: mismatch-specific DNA-glycosylase [Clostridia bacterium]|nr:mismatch-specific DNA-glycosylase [Clostridia bacterium]